MAMPTKAQRLALHSIVSHYLADVRVARRELINTIRCDRRDFNNFLTAAAEKGTDKIRDKFSDLVANEIYYIGAPAHVQVAMRECFGYSPDAAPENADFPKVLAGVADYDERILRTISDFYEGVWHIIRYSAHVEHLDLKALPDGTLDAWVVRAGMQVFPRATAHGRNLPTFRVHYRPKRLVDNNDFFHTEGVLASIGEGQHLQFVGKEYNTGYPLIITAPQDKTPPKSFRGIVNRKHEQGQIFASKVMFVRTETVTLADITRVAGIYRESSIREQFSREMPNVDMDRVFESVNNKVPNDGKCAMLL